jgi:putative DNA primase/helicase
MMPASVHDAVREFYDALCAVGLSPARTLNIQADGRIHRYRVEGDKAGSGNGWYVLYPDGAIPAGAFGSWRTGETHTWAAKREQEFSPHEREEWRRKTEEARQQREREQDKVRQTIAEKAKKLWELARPAAADGDDAHPYVRSKAIKPYGLRRLKAMLVIPVRNAASHLTSLQFIGPDGSKRFLTGGEVAAGYCAIGRPEGTLCVCEGFATGASLREATGHAVAVAFNAGNLLPVAKVLREKFPAARILVCADNDQFTDGNPGLSRARSAAEQVGGLVVWPSFEAHELETKPTDFNDLAALRGLDAVRDAIENACENVVPINAARSRKDLETLIDATEDFEELTERLAGEVNGSGLPRAARDYLLHRIAKKAKCTKASLMVKDKDRPRTPRPNEPDWLAWLNERHAVIPVGGKVMVVTQEWEPAMSRSTFQFSDRTNFELRYCNRKIWHQGEEIPLGKYWIEHPQRREYDGLVFLPAAEQPGYLNLWQGWGVEPRLGACRLFNDFISDVLCDGDDELHDYLLSWCAHIVQRPAELPETAIVLRGQEGIGKNTFVDVLQAIVGNAHFVPVARVDKVTGQFTAHLASALLVFCNESVWGGDKAAQGTLKSMITDPTQTIEGKHKDAYTVRSYRRMIFATNEKWAVPRGADDRRYVILDVSAARKGDAEYWQSIRHEMANGGTEAWMQQLLDRDLSDWHPRSVPRRLLARGWEMKIESGGSPVKWWFEVLQNGWLVKEDRQFAEEPEEQWPRQIAMHALQDAYRNWCLKSRVTHPESVSMLGRSLHEWGIGTARPRKDNPGRKLYYQIPEIEVARRRFSALFNIPDKVWADHDADEDGEVFA